MTEEERIEEIRLILQEVHPHLVNRMLAVALVKNGFVRAKPILICDCCERECKRPCTYPALQKGDAAKVMMCQTCWGIWYDGCTDLAEIKKFSILWPVDFIGAYATEKQENIKQTLEFANKIKRE